MNNSELTPYAGIRPEYTTPSIERMQEVFERVSEQIEALFDGMRYVDDLDIHVSTDKNIFVRELSFERPSMDIFSEETLYMNERTKMPFIKQSVVRFSQEVVTVRHEVSPRVDAPDESYLICMESSGEGERYEMFDMYEFIKWKNGRIELRYSANNPIAIEDDEPAQIKRDMTEYDIEQFEKVMKGAWEYVQTSEREDAHVQAAYNLAVEAWRERYGIVDPES